MQSGQYRKLSRDEPYRLRNSTTDAEEAISMLRKTMSWVAGLALAYVVLRTVPDIVRYIKISTM